MNALDSAISWFSPVAGLRRARARAALNVLEKFAYEGAKTGRRTEGWTAGGGSANAEIGSSLTKLRERSRQILRDTPHGPKAVKVVCANLVGTGITPRTSTGNPNLDKQVSDLWSRWAEEADADDQINLYGLQKLAVRTVFESGEAIVRYRPRRSEDGMATIPLQLQVMEPDHLDLSRTQELQNGGYILQGVEFDAIGTRVAYWLFKTHPGDMVSFRTGSLVSVRVPASEVLHIYDKQRAGQVRGVPWLAPVLLKMRDLDDYDEAELVRKKIESCFAAFVTQPEGEDGLPLGTTSTQEGTGTPPNRIEQFEPGMIEYLKPGESVAFGNPKGEGGYSEYSKTQLRAIAAGLGITYEQLTGDLSNTNYSSYRAGQLDFRAWIEDFRWNAFMPMFCFPIWKRFIDTSIINGRLPVGEYPAKWTAPPFQSVQPLEDAKANEQKMRNGLLTLREAIVGEGFDPDEQFEEIAATNKLLDQLGIILDCDPRKSAKTAAGRPPGEAAAEANSFREYATESRRITTEAISDLRNEQGELRGSLTGLLVAANRVPPPVPPPNISLSPSVSVHLPEQQPPIVNVEAPAAPNITVTAPEVKVINSPAKKVRKRIERDAKGKLTGIVEESE